MDRLALRRKLNRKQGTSKVTFVLTMIVKHESRIICRLLNSMKSMLDYICITDTGSVLDNTPDIIREWGAANNIPTVVHVQPFVNFAVSRTHSLVNAVKSFPTATYMLLSDADFMWVISPDFKKQDLIADRYDVLQKSPNQTWPNVRLLKMSVMWHYIGRTHEICEVHKDYLKPVIPGDTIDPAELYIDDRGDGGCKADKYQRDERLLKEGIADPRETKQMHLRYRYYLGQTLMEVNRYEEAIKYYREFLAMSNKGNSYNFQCWQNIGKSYEYWGNQMSWCVRLYCKLSRKGMLRGEEAFIYNLCNPDNKPPTWLLARRAELWELCKKNYIAAWRDCPTRSETLYELVRFLRTIGECTEAYKYILIGQKIKKPVDVSGIVFLNDKAYDYLFDFELSIVADHLDLPNKKEIGREVSDRLLLRRDLTDEEREIVLKNLTWY